MLTTFIIYKQRGPALPPTHPTGLLLPPYPFQTTHWWERHHLRSGTQEQSGPVTTSCPLCQSREQGSEDSARGKAAWTAGVPSPSGAERSRLARFHSYIMFRLWEPQSCISWYRCWKFQNKLIGSIKERFIARHLELNKPILPISVNVY